MPAQVDPPARRPRKRTYKLPESLRGCKYEAGNVRPSDVYSVTPRQFVEYLQYLERRNSPRRCKIVAFRQPKEGEDYIAGVKSVWDTFDEEFKSRGELTITTHASWSCHPKGPRFIYALNS